MSLILHLNAKTLAVTGGDKEPISPTELIFTLNVRHPASLSQSLVPYRACLGLEPESVL